MDYFTLDFSSSSKSALRGFGGGKGSKVCKKWSIFRQWEKSSKKKKIILNVSQNVFKQ